MPKRRVARVFPASVACTQGGGYINFGAHAAYNLASGAIEFWWRPPTTLSAAGAYAGIACLQTSTSNFVRLCHLSGGTIILEAVRAGVSISSGSGLMPRAGAFHHVVMWWSATGMGFTLDGVAGGLHTAASSAMEFPSNPSLTVGAFSTVFTSGTGGTFTDVVLHPTVPTLAQIQAKYEEGIDWDTPVARWAFDDTTGTSVALTSGSGNAGTITSGVWSMDVPMAPRNYARNLLKNSSLVGATGWTAAGLIAWDVNDTVPSPLLGSTAVLTKVYETAGTNVRYIDQDWTIAASGGAVPAYVAYSCVVKLATRSARRLTLGVFFASVQFEIISNAMFVSTGNGVFEGANAEAVHLGDDYWQFIVSIRSRSITELGGAGESVFRLVFYPAGGATSSYTVAAGAETHSYVGECVITTGATHEEARDRARASMLTTTKPLFFGERKMSHAQNLFRWSDDRTKSAAWTLTGTTTSMDGTLDPFSTPATKVLQTTANTAHESYQGAIAFPTFRAHVISSLAGVIYTHWAIVKAIGGQQYIGIYMQSPQTFVMFDMVSCVLVHATGIGQLLSSGCRDLGNGWRLIWQSAPILNDGNNTNHSVYMMEAANSTYAAFVGDVTKGYYVSRSGLHAGIGEPDLGNVPKTTASARRGVPRRQLQSPGNFIPHSKDMVSAWGLLNTGAVTFTHGITGPFGATNATRLTAAGAGSLSHAVYANTFAYTANWKLRFSVWAKDVSAGYLRLFENTGAGAVFRMSDGVATTVGSGIQAWAGPLLANGWRRYSIVIASSNGYPTIAPSPNSTGANYTQNGETIDVSLPLVEAWHPKAPIPLATSTYYAINPEPGEYVETDLGAMTAAGTRLQ